MPDGSQDSGENLDAEGAVAPNAVDPEPDDRARTGTEAKQGVEGGTGAGATPSSAGGTETHQNPTHPTGAEGAQGVEGGTSTETELGPEGDPGTRTEDGSVHDSTSAGRDVPEGAPNTEPTGGAGPDTGHAPDDGADDPPAGDGATPESFCVLMSRLDATPSLIRADEIDMEIDDAVPEGWSAGHVEAWQLFDDIEPLACRSLASIFSQPEAFPETRYDRVDEDNHRFSFPAVDLDGAAWDPSVRVKVSTAEPEKDAAWVSVEALPHGQRAEELYIQGRIFVHILVEDGVPGGRRRFQRLVRAVTLDRVPLADISNRSTSSHGGEP